MTNKKKMKIAVGMSGGVDSSVAAALLKKQGYDVIGVFLKFWSDNSFTGESKISNKCCSVESMQDARRVCNKLDIDLITLNMRNRFKEFIVDNFLEEYEAGNTPNPCVRCNQFVKTGYFLEKMRELGINFIATGHYANIVNNEDGTSDILLPTDKNKDQTYFLYRLNQDTVSHTLFPLSEYTKNKVRELAKNFGLPTHSKHDSLDICFVADQGHNEFLKRWIKIIPGEIIDTNGVNLGKHNGTPLYTYGQRKGLDIGGPGGPWYVIDKNIKKNQIIVTDDDSYPGLFKKDLIIHDSTWINKEPDPNKTYGVKLRYRHEPAKATLKPTQKGEYEIIFQEPQRAVTPGQSAVVYDKNKMLGGGIIK